MNLQQADILIELIRLHSATPSKVEHENHEREERIEELEEELRDSTEGDD